MAKKNLGIVLAVVGLVSLTNGVEADGPVRCTALDKQAFQKIKTDLNWVRALLVCDPVLHKSI